MSFTAPVRAQRLILDSVVRIGELPGAPDSEMVDAVLEGAAQLAEGEFAPLLRIGDTVGARWDNGAVIMPEGFKAAWRSFVEGGWMTLAAPEHHGGQGLPFVLSAALSGAAGATKALVVQLASLTDVHWAMSGEVVLMTLLGGMGTVFGPMVGAALVITMQHYLAAFGAWVTVIQGAIFVICVMLFREGIVGVVGRWLKRPL